MKRLTVISALILMLPSIYGCEIMSEDECRQANWYEQGYIDGTQGQSSAVLKDYQKACSKYVNVDQVQYMSGRREGAEIYCNPNRAFSLGANGTALTDVCRGTKNEREFNNLYNRGRVVYSAKTQVDTIDSKIAMLGQYLNDDRFYGMSPKIRADIDYLEDLRRKAAYQYSTVQAQAQQGDITIYDYTAGIYRMPYPKVFDELNMANDNIQRAEYERNRIRSRMDSEYRCMKNTDDPDRYSKCQWRYQCWQTAEYELQNHLYHYLRGYNLDHTEYFDSHSRKCN